tara:strand:- start:6663 stop:9107 length:2445 start_codon:yes stop_codon:yes gene_type:complete
MKSCYHCGDPCKEGIIEEQDKHFCCHGCKTVYDILSENDLSYYYHLESAPGTSPSRFDGKFDFLENESIVASLLDFDENDRHVVSFTIPSIHCSSCIWVLENLHKLEPAVQSVQVNFPKKTARITYGSAELTLHDLVVLLSKIGYEPYISLEDTTEKDARIDRSLIYKLGVAGFAFGNIMFLSFPEYFEVHDFWLDRFKHLFRWLMFGFSIPVVFYSGQDYLISAFKSLRAKLLNIDVPIALGILVLFIRSTLEIAMDWGTGFFDSLSGLVFFLLLGKFFQQKTYSYLSFERDYKSYFPIAVTRLNKTASEAPMDSKETQVPINELSPGDRILIRNEELIPVDGILINGTALIDYSFVTGEAEPVAKQSGDTLYAGGRQQAGIIEVEVIKSVDQSYLTQLWSNDVFAKGQATFYKGITNSVSKHFTISLLTIAIIATTFWGYYQPSLALNVFTAVLIVACPCAIALAAPFTLGNMLRIFGRHKLYAKNSSVIEQLAEVDTVVFDKTGTLTTNKKGVITYQGIALTSEEETLLTATLRASNHPLSRSLYELLRENEIYTLDSFEEEVGKGLTGRKEYNQIKVGGYDFVANDARGNVKGTTLNRTSVHVSSNQEYKGCYVFNHEYRPGVQTVFQELSETNNLVVLSGDNDGEKAYLSQLLPNKTRFVFNQKPEDKLAFIKRLQQDGKKVLMVGDGLNDAGALAQSDVGIVISENINVFSPACDGILNASRFTDLTTFIRLSQQARKVIKYAFVFSLIYNLIGLGFAVTGQLRPVVAAILMPLSSISIVVFTTLYTHYLSRQLKIQTEYEMGETVTY